jgi:hypothetical protein
MYKLKRGGNLYLRLLGLKTKAKALSYITIAAFWYHYLLAFSFVLLIKCLKILEDAVINPVRKDGALDSIFSNRKKFSIDSSPPPWSRAF